MSPKKKFREVVINRCFGGFGLSHEAMMRYAELKGLKVYPMVEDRSLREQRDEDGRSRMFDPRYFIPYTGKEECLCVHYYFRKPTRKMSRETGDTLKTLYDRNIKRDDPILIQVVREFKKKAAGRFGELKIIKIPVDVKWTLEEYDGMEHIAEVHRTWS